MNNSFEDKIKLHNDLQKFQVEKSIVGSEAYLINQDIQKGVSQDEILEKARSGVYKPTKQNLKSGKAGQKYGAEKKEAKKTSNKIEFDKTKVLNLSSEELVNLRDKIGDEINFGGRTEDYSENDINENYDHFTKVFDFLNKELIKREKDKKKESKKNR